MKRGCDTRQMRCAVRARLAGQPPEPVIGLERIAAALDVGEDLAEQLLAEGRHKARPSAPRRASPPRGTAPAQAAAMICWASTSIAPGRKISGIELARLDRVESGPGLEIFEAVAGDEDRLGGLVEPVVGAADPLEQARRALRARPSGRPGRRRPSRLRGRGWRCRPGRAACRRPSPPRPCAAPRATASRGGSRSADAPRSTVHRSWKISSREAARVAEDQGRLVPLDLAHHVLRRPAAAMARPGDLLVLGQHDRRSRPRRRDRP